MNRPTGRVTPKANSVGSKGWPAARFTLRTGSAGSKGIASGIASSLSPAPVYRAVILSAAKDLSFC
jgi:hypothetical protein